MARSHGTGQVNRDSLASCGTGVVFEFGALVFHPENVEIADDVYVGHYAILKGYYQNRLVIGAGTWIGQHAFLHSAGGLTIGRTVGIGPGVRIITSSHDIAQLGPNAPIMEGDLTFAPVVLGDGCDIGVNATILPGVTIGARAQVGAGAVVTTDVAANTIVAGVPAKPIGGI